MRFLTIDYGRPAIKQGFNASWCNQVATTNLKFNGYANCQMSFAIDNVTVWYKGCDVNDLTGDCAIDMANLAVIAGNWLVDD